MTTTTSQPFVTGSQNPVYKSQPGTTTTTTQAPPESTMMGRPSVTSYPHTAAATTQDFVVDASDGTEFGDFNEAPSAAAAATTTNSEPTVNNDELLGGFASYTGGGGAAVASVKQNTNGSVFGRYAAQQDDPFASLGPGPQATTATSSGISNIGGIDQVAPPHSQPLGTTSLGPQMAAAAAAGTTTGFDESKTPETRAQGVHHQSDPFGYLGGGSSVEQPIAGGRVIIAPVSQPIISVQPAAAPFGQMADAGGGAKEEVPASAVIPVPNFGMGRKTSAIVPDKEEEEEDPFAHLDGGPQNEDMDYKTMSTFDGSAPAPQTEGDAVAHQVSTGDDDFGGCFDEFQSAAPPEAAQQHDKPVHSDKPTTAISGGEQASLPQPPPSTLQPSAGSATATKMVQSDNQGPVSGEFSVLGLGEMPSAPSLGLVSAGSWEAAATTSAATDHHGIIGGDVPGAPPPGIDASDGTEFGDFNAAPATNSDDAYVEADGTAKRDPQPQGTDDLSGMGVFASASLNDGDTDGGVHWTEDKTSSQGALKNPTLPTESQPSNQDVVETGVASEFSVLSLYDQSDQADAINLSDQAAGVNIEPAGIDASDGTEFGDFNGACMGYPPLNTNAGSRDFDGGGIAKPLADAQSQDGSSDGIDGFGDFAIALTEDGDNNGRVASGGDNGKTSSSPLQTNGQSDEGFGVFGGFDNAAVTHERDTTPASAQPEYNASVGVMRDPQTDGGTTEKVQPNEFTSATKEHWAQEKQIVGLSDGFDQSPPAGVQAEDTVQASTQPISLSDDEFGGFGTAASAQGSDVEQPKRKADDEFVGDVHEAPEDKNVDNDADLLSDDDFGDFGGFESATPSQDDEVEQQPKSLEEGAGFDSQLPKVDGNGDPVYEDQNSLAGIGRMEPAPTNQTGIRTTKLEYNSSSFDEAAQAPYESNNANDARGLGSAGPTQGNEVEKDSAHAEGAGSGDFDGVPRSADKTKAMSGTHGEDFGDFGEFDSAVPTRDSDADVGGFGSFDEVPETAEGTNDTTGPQHDDFGESDSGAKERALPAQEFESSQIHSSGRPTSHGFDAFGDAPQTVDDIRDTDNDEVERFDSATPVQDKGKEPPSTTADLDQAVPAPGSEIEQHEQAADFGDFDEAPQEQVDNNTHDADIGSFGGFDGASQVQSEETGQANLLTSSKDDDEGFGDFDEAHQNVLESNGGAEDDDFDDFGDFDSAPVLTANSPSETKGQSDEEEDDFGELESATVDSVSEPSTPPAAQPPSSDIDFQRRAISKFQVLFAKYDVDHADAEPDDTNTTQEATRLEQVLVCRLTCTKKPSSRRHSHS